MTERERLVKLLKSDSCESPMLCDPNCKYANLEKCYEERTADYLLANGVHIIACATCDYIKYLKDEGRVIELMGKFGNRYSYFYTDWFPIKFSGVNFVSYRISKRHYVQKHYTLQDLIDNLPADEMIEYLKDNGFNVCPIVR